jgi:hypothetical protein
LGKQFSETLAEEIGARFDAGEPEGVGSAGERGLPSAY